MKTFFMTLVFLVSFPALAQEGFPFKKPIESTPQTNVLPSVAPGASIPALKEIQPHPKDTPVAQKQEASQGLTNPYPIGDYGKNGEYNFFDRSEREKREAQEEAAEQ